MRGDDTRKPCKGDAGHFEGLTGEEPRARKEQQPKLVLRKAISMNNARHTWQSASRAHRFVSERGPEWRKERSKGRREVGRKAERGA